MPRTTRQIERYKREERKRHGRYARIIAGFLDPQTRADEVRIIRARSGLPVGMPTKPGLENRPPAGTWEPAS